LTVGQRIKFYREDQGLSINKLAEASTVSKGYLSQLESGEASNPSRAVLESLADALRVRVSDLLGEEPILPGKLPKGLADFRVREAAKGTPLPDEDVKMLLGIRYRGRHPRTADDWAYLYETIKRTIK
jgi:transcriptional regulator with XRE-family HTH domain